MDLPEEASMSFTVTISLAEVRPWNFGRNLRGGMREVGVVSKGFAAGGWRRESW